MKFFVNAVPDYCLISSPVEEEKAVEDFSAGTPHSQKCPKFSNKFRQFIDKFLLNLPTNQSEALCKRGS